MTFLDRYNAELKILRESGSRFSKEHPQVASQLGLQAGSVTDPFVERLLEGIAFLSARVHSRLDREASEFASQALASLSPLFMRSTPGVVVLSFDPDFGSPEAFRAGALPKGSLVSSEFPDQQQPVTWATTRDVRLWPLKLVDAQCVRGLASIPSVMASALANAQALVKLDFSVEGGAKAGDLGKQSGSLSLSLAGDLPKAFELHRALVSDTTDLWLLAGEGAEAVAHPLPLSSLKFEAVQPEASIFPDDVGALPGVRVLREYFACPQRFLSLELDVLAQVAKLAPAVKRFSVVFKLKRTPSTLIGDVQVEQFRMFAVPCVNLYDKRFDPVPYEDSKTGQWMVVDRMRPMAHHVWSVDQVGVSMEDGVVLEAWSALNMGDFYSSDTQARYSWRRETLDEGTGTKRDNGLDALGIYDEISVAITDPAYSLAQVHHIQVKGLVCDRGWRAGSAVNARYQLEESKAVEKIECLWAASAPRPMPDANECWTALPHLGDNPLGQYSAKATDITDRIKDLLCLASVGSNAMDVQRSSSLRKVFATPVFMEAGRSSPMAWVRGQKVSIFVSSSDHPDKGAWLFGRVLAQALFESVYLNDGVEFEIHIDDELCSTHTNLNNKTGALL